MGFSLLLRCQTAPGWGDGTVPPSTLLVPGWKAMPGVLPYLPSWQGHRRTMEACKPRGLSSKAKPCLQHPCVLRQHPEPPKPPIAFCNWGTHRDDSEIHREGSQLSPMGWGRIPAQSKQMRNAPSSGQVG